MGWTNNPKVRALEPYAKKHGFNQVIVVGVRPDGNFEVISYGITAGYCDDAKKVNQQIYDRIASGDIEVEP